MKGKFYEKWQGGYIYICGMDVPTLKLVLRPILTVTSVYNTGEIGDIFGLHLFGPMVIFSPMVSV